jgi:hypothetical protein
MADETNAAVKADDGAVIPRLALKETGYLGLRTNSGTILAEQNHAFRFPQFHQTIAEMRANPTVGAAMNVYRCMITRPKWCVKPSVGADAKQIARARLVETMMHDMEDSWEAFIHSVVPYIEYGYGIHNIVAYRRLPRNGSRYSDGLVGIRKLAVRNQETIVRWVFDQDNRDLLKVEQSIHHLEQRYTTTLPLNENGNIDLPRDSFLLFTASATSGNPQGHSIYRNIYLSYKQLTMLQDNQLLSVAKNAAGVLKIEVPAAYLQGEASPDGGVAAEGFKKLIDGHNNGTNRGLLVPQQIDYESKLPMFDYSLMEEKGTARNDVESIIKGLQNDIAIALSVDVLRLGADGTGSFSLASAKSSILALAIDARLKEIRSVLNRHLMRFIFEMNGWGIEEMPTFEYSDVEDIDLETMGKFCQQVISVGGLEMDRPVMNRIRVLFGVAPLPEDQPVNEDKLGPNMTGKTTMAGEGMKTAGTGTSKSPNGAKDASAANANNK